VFKGLKPTLWILTALYDGGRPRLADTWCPPTLAEVQSRSSTWTLTSSQRMS